LKVSGFPDDDARRLQVHLDQEWVTTKAERLKGAKLAYEKKRKDDAELAARMHDERLVREEEETLASDASASFLLNLIRGSSTPPTLTLNRYPPPVIRAFVNAIGSNSSVQALDLMGCNLTDAQIARSLRVMLEQNKSLVRLDLDWNSLTAGGLYHIAKGLQVNKTLVSLSLEGNKLCVRGEGGHAEGLYAHCPEGDEARNSASVAIPSVPHPTSVSATTTSTASSLLSKENSHQAAQVSELSGMEALCQAIANHPTLLHLNLFETGLGKEGGDILASAVISSGLHIVQVSPSDGVSDTALSSIVRRTAANRAEGEAKKREALEAEALAVRRAELEAAAREAEEAAARDAGWEVKEAERRKLFREEAERIRLKGEISERAARAQDYKEYLVHKATLAELKAAKEKSKK